MGDLCNAVTGFASLFIVLAFIVVLVDMVIALIAKVQALRAGSEAQDKHPKFAPDNIGPALEGLAKVLAALKDLPPWIAIFLAGLALIWTRIYAANLCT